MQQNNIILLSIIIPVYNVESYLKECLDSIVYYERDDIEIIAVNDGSTDNSLSILKEYSVKHPIIRIVNQENQGLSAARNSGIQVSKGKYLLFLDSDDFLFPGVLDLVIFDINKDQGKEFFLGRAYKYRDGEDTKELCQVDYSTINYSSPSHLFLSLHKKSSFWFAAWLLIINRQFLISNNLYFKTGIYHEDELWVPSVFVIAKNMGTINYGFYCYRTEREGSIVTSPKIKREFDKLIVADELNNLIGESGVSDMLIKDRQASIVFGIMLTLHKFEENIAYADMINSLNKHMYMLKYGKYFLVYIAYRVFGIKFVSSCLKYLF